MTQYSVLKSQYSLKTLFLLVFGRRAIRLERDFEQCPQIVRFLFGHVGIYSVNEFGIIGGNVRTQHPIPEGENIPKIGVSVWLAVVVVYAVHVGGANHPHKQVVEPSRHCTFEWLNWVNTTERVWYRNTIHMGAPTITTAKVVKISRKTLSPG